jgi:uncharacterized membrane protein YkvA (DUF1232 family)
MTIIARIRSELQEGLRKALTELLALWFLFLDKRVPRHTRALVLLPFLYVLSPIDLIPDRWAIVGQVDDLLIVRLSYALLKRIVAPGVLEENRERAKRFFLEEGQRRYKVLLVLLAVWIVVLAFFGLYFFKKAHRHLR